MYFKNREPLIISYQYTDTVACTFKNFFVNPFKPGCYKISVKSKKLPVSDVQILLSTSWTYRNWQFEDKRECQAMRLCFKRTRIQRAKQDQLESHKTKNMIFAFIDLHAEQWAKREQYDLKYLSKWKQTLKNLLKTEFKV